MPHTSPISWISLFFYFSFVFFSITMYVLNLVSFFSSFRYLVQSTNSFFFW